MPTGTKDAARRERIVRAAIDVVAKSGIEGLTHRAVAAVAEVPLGSTTYYFSSLDDLLEAAILEVMEMAAGEHAAWDERLERKGGDMTAAITELLVSATGPSRDSTIVEYELYIAAMKRPPLRAISQEWARTLPDSLAQHVDRVTAEALAIAVDGFILQSLISGEPLVEAEIEPVIRRIVS